MLGRLQDSLVELALDCPGFEEINPSGKFSSLPPLLLPKLTRITFDCMPPAAVGQLIGNLQTPSLINTEIECDLNSTEPSNSAEVILASLMKHASTYPQLRVHILPSDRGLLIQSLNVLGMGASSDFHCYRFNTTSIKRVFRTLKTMRATFLGELDIRLHWSAYRVRKTSDFMSLASTWSEMTHWIGSYTKSIKFCEGDRPYGGQPNAYLAIRRMVANRDRFPKLAEVVIPYFEFESEELLGLVEELEELEPPVTLVLFEGFCTFDSDIETLEKTKANVRTVREGVIA